MEKAYQPTATTSKRVLIIFLKGLTLGAFFYHSVYYMYTLCKLSIEYYIYTVCKLCGYIIYVYIYIYMQRCIYVYMQFCTYVYMLRCKDVKMKKYIYK